MLGSALLLSLIDEPLAKQAGRDVILLIRDVHDHSVRARGDRAVHERADARKLGCSLLQGHLHLASAVVCEGGRGSAIAELIAQPDEAIAWRRVLARRESGFHRRADGTPAAFVELLRHRAGHISSALLELVREVHEPGLERRNPCRQHLIAWGGRLCVGACMTRLVRREDARRGSRLKGE